jgi:hypothetical protein
MKFPQELGKTFQLYKMTSCRQWVSFPISEPPTQLCGHLQCTLDLNDSFFHLYMTNRMLLSHYGPADLYIW